MTAKTYARLLLALSVTLALNATAGRAVPSAAHADAAVTHTVCIAHRPGGDIYYAPGCTGHDEPELDPLSSAPHSAQDLTWSVVLPTDATTHVGIVGPTFWIGGVVSDINSLYGQAFLELQFYPNSMVSGCGPGGGFRVTYTPGVYTACSPVWAVYGQNELAAFNAMLVDNDGNGPLVMHAGDTITDHQYITNMRDGMHITVRDLTTGHSGTIVLNSKKDGPLMPAYDTQQLGNALKWGLVYDAPNSFVWEIGHTSNYTTPPGQFCLPGQSGGNGVLACDSYNIQSWLGFRPLQVQGVTVAGGGSASGWAAVSDFGGEAEVNQYCPRYGAPFCWYPWYAYNGNDAAYTYGGDYPGTANDFGQALEFTQTKQCPSPLGPNTTYCATRLR